MGNRNLEESAMGAADALPSAAAFSSAKAPRGRDLGMN